MRDELPVPDFSPVSPPTSRVSLWLLEWNGDPRDAIGLQMGAPDAEARRALTQLPAQLLSDVDETFARTLGLGIGTTLWLGLKYAFGVKGYSMMGRLVDVPNGGL
ncbi:MAG: hypothetical protein H6722_25570 [Sandaracinus sp.]|nr:hypothetical protein [Myxococcales bacterium]MCB9615817.1 hypothetical protein [Sandaracinus sp.]